MNIISINSDRFAPAFRQAGHQIKTAGHEDFYDIVLEPKDCSLDRALKESGFEPDFILVECFGPKPFFRGIEECPYPLVLYAVDSSLNMFWLESYAQLFDLILVDQKSSVAALAKKGKKAYWLPLAVNAENFRNLRHSQEYDITFVGRINNRRLKRATLLKELNRHYDLAIGGGEGGDYLHQRQTAEFHACGKLALNENLFDGVTQRIFEIMASGTALLTEESENGLGDLFEDGVHLITFDSANLRGKIDYYLKNSPAREAIAQLARAEIFEKHTYEVRIHRLLELVEANLSGSEQERDLPARYAASAKACYLAALRWNHLTVSLLRQTENACLTALERESTDIEVLKTLGLMQGKWGSFETAESCFQKVLSIAEADVETCLYLGHLYFKYGDYEKAGQYFYLGIDKIPGLSECLRQEVLRYSASADFANLWIIMGDALATQRALWTPGFSKYQPDDFPYYPVEYYDKAYREYGSSEGLLKMADSYFKYDLYGEAYQLYLEALNICPDRGDIHFKAGSAAINIYKREEALDLITKGLYLSPKLYPGIFNLPLKPAEISLISEHFRNRLDLKKAIIPL